MTDDEYRKSNLVVGVVVWSAGSPVGVASTVVTEGAGGDSAAHWSNARSRDLAAVVSVHACREATVLARRAWGSATSTGGSSAVLTDSDVASKWSLWAQGASRTDWAC